MTAVETCSDEQLRERRGTDIPGTPLVLLMPDAAGVSFL